MISGIFDLQKQFDCYVDGVFRGSVSLSSANYLGVQTSAPIFGKPMCCQPFNGSLDDVRIYNRALSADEVLSLYNATK